jgi:hypothetical protein
MTAVPQRRGFDPESVPGDRLTLRPGGTYIEKRSTVLALSVVVPNRIARLRHAAIVNPPDFDRSGHPSPPTLLSITTFATSLSGRWRRLYTPTE